MAENRNRTTTFRENLQYLTLNKPVQMFRRKQTNRERHMYNHYRHVGIVFNLYPHPEIVVLNGKKAYILLLFPIIICRDSVFVGLGKVYTLLFTALFSSKAVMLDIKVFRIPRSVHIISKQNIISICVHLRQAIHF